MKTLLAISTTLLISLPLVAGQCEGLTQQGERCKREAAEGCAYCIGHKEQEPKTALDKEKDDGQCWAITEAGTRCKHNKNGESDYCKQHAPDVKPAKEIEQCRAITYDGKQCSRKPVEGGRYCKQHNK